MIPMMDVRAPSGDPSPVPYSQSPIARDQTLKKQWCSGRIPEGYPPNMRSWSNPLAHRPDVDKHFKWNSAMDCQLPNRLKDDELIPLLDRVLIKVRNVHPTACLHELHVQRRELFPKKPTFDTTKFPTGNRRKGNFAVECNFEINGAKLYT